MTQRRPLAMCLAVLLAATITSCGGSSGSDKASEQTPKHTTTTLGPCIEKTARYLNDEVDLSRLQDPSYEAEFTAGLDGCDLAKMTDTEIGQITNLLNVDTKKALGVPEAPPSTVPGAAPTTTTTAG